MRYWNTLLLLLAAPGFAFCQGEVWESFLMADWAGEPLETAG